MHRFYLPPEACAGKSLLLTGREAHHASRVLRLRRGDSVCVLDGAGKQCRCEITDLGRDTVALSVVEEDHATPHPFRLTLLQAVPKGKTFETIIQKATELGVSQIIPVLAERAVVHLEAEAAEHKVEKWQQVAIEAIKQCGCRWLPQIAAARHLGELLAEDLRLDLTLVGSLHGGARHPRYYFQEYRLAHDRPPGSVGVWIGPEGDFTPAELKTLEASGARPITLGQHVLRADTAAIYSLSVVSYELQAP